MKKTSRSGGLSGSIIFHADIGTGIWKGISCMLITIERVFNCGCGHDKLSPLSYELFLLEWREGLIHAAVTTKLHCENYKPQFNQRCNTPS